jgi:hypothetical protein
MRAKAYRDLEKAVLKIHRHTHKKDSLKHKGAARTRPAAAAPTPI